MRSLLPLCLLLVSCFGGGAADSADSAVEVDSDTPAPVSAWRRWPTDDPREVPTAPHVVLLIGCTWRADQLGPWGGRPDVAPTLSRLAAQGVVFERTIAQAPWTRPAAAAILTGRYPDDLGITEPSFGPNHRGLPASAHTLPERLHEAGWSTVAVVSNPNLSSLWGFDQGFDVYVEAFPEWTRTAGIETADEVRSRGPAVVKHALAEVAARPDRKRPVFLEVVLIDAHAPRRVSPEAQATFAEADLPDEVARYRAGLNQADLALKELVEGLPAAGIPLEETIFVLVGDHGEGLELPPSHGQAHGFTLYPSTTHVPWVISGAGIGRGRIGGLSTQLDLAPTVLGLLGLGKVGLVGEDLSVAVKAGQGSAVRDTAYTSTRLRWADRSAAITADMHCQIDHDDKATAQSISKGRGLEFSTGCCRILEDPACDRPEWDPGLLERLRGWRSDRQQAHTAAEAQTAEPNEVLRMQLRALGYAE